MKKYIKSLLDVKSISYILVILVCVFLHAICSFYPITVIQKMVDMAADAGKSAAGMILKWGILYLGVQVLNAGFMSLTVYFTKTFQARTAFRTQIKIYQSLSRMQIQYIKSSHTSELNNYLIKDTEYCAENLIQPYVKGTLAILKFIFGFYFMSRIHLYLTLIIIPLGVISSVVIDFVRKKTAENFVEQREFMQRLWKTFSEGICGFLPIRLHRYSETYYRKVEVDGERLMKSQIRESKLESLTEFCTTSMFMASIGVILIISSILVSKGTLSIGGLTAILMYNHMLTDPIMDFVAINRNLAKLKVCVERLQSVLGLPKDEENLPIVSVDEILLLKMNFSFGERSIVQDMDLRLKAPMSLAIFGETGIGKTTLANVISHVYKAEPGQVLYKWKGKAVEGIPRISYLLQDEYLFDDTIKNNVRVGNTGLSEEDYQALIRDCCLTSVVERHCGTIGENGSLLSGGERKRVLLARTLADFDADIFVFDELSAFLDVDTFEMIFTRVEKRLKNKIRIYIEHNRMIEGKVDKIVVF